MIVVAVTRVQVPPLRRPGKEEGGGRGEAQEGWRFKLYQLDSEGQWDDKGTGFLTIKNDEVGR